MHYKSDGNEVVFKIGASEYKVNGVTKKMDVNSYMDERTNSTYDTQTKLIESLAEIDTAYAAEAFLS